MRLYNLPGLPRGLFILLLLFISPITRCQVFTETYNSLIDHFRDTVISVTSADNAIIHGIDNKLIVRKQLFRGEVNSQFDNKFILSREGNIYILKAPGLETNENISLLIGNFRHDTLFYRTFRNHALPLPSVYFGHVNLSQTGKLKLSELQIADSVYLFFNYNLTGSSDWFKVKRFTIGYSYGSYYITHDNNGNLITNKTKSVLMGLKPGQEVSISILAEGEGSLSKEVPLIYFKIE